MRRTMTTDKPHAPRREQTTTSGHRFGVPERVERVEEKGVRLTESIKRQFHREVPLLALRLPAPLIGRFKADPRIKPALLVSKNLRSVEPDPSSDDGAHKLLLLNTPHKDEVPDETLKVVQEQHVDLVETRLELTWDYWMADEIIARLLPQHLTHIPASFTIIGHIAHFNLRDDFLPYKYLIGQVVLEKNPAIKTVVNKVDTINTQFRFFQMELLAGEPNYMVTLWQSGSRYRFDFSKVYYNPRLSTEHDELSTKVQKNEVVVDGFAGVGPFALRVAKNRGGRVMASDLNPAAVEALATNVRLNKLADRVDVSCGDGRLKIRDAVLRLWRNPPFHSPHIPLLPDHFIINLPDSAISFLDSFIGLYHPLQLDNGFLDAVHAKNRGPLLHCYCFTKHVDHPEPDICQRVSAVMETDISRTTAGRFELKFVRAVAPHKDMYRLTFELPLELLLRPASAPSAAVVPAA